jgi:hypothetical protein
MNDAQTRPDGQTAWMRHYDWAAERRQATHRRRRAHPHFTYRQREVRWAYALATLVVALVVVAWRILK